MAIVIDGRQYKYRLLSLYTKAEKKQPYRVVYKTKT